MRVLIADDERRARRRLAGMLGVWPDVEVVGEASDGLAALDAIRTLAPDAVFLDIQMPGLNGFEMLSALPREKCPAVVFVTAYDEYALRAFEVSAVDYLLKPVEPERLKQAMERLRRPPAVRPVERLVNALGTHESLRRVVGKRLHKLHVLPVDQIEAFQVEDELVFAFNSAGRFVVDKTLRALEAALDSTQFVRVHKRAIVNLSHLALLEPISKGGATARLTSGEIVKISRRYQPELRRRLGY